MYIAAGQEQTTSRGTKKLMSTETSCHFGHLLKVSEKSLWRLILYTFFHDFIHVYSLTTPWGWNYDVNRNVLSLRSFLLQVSKEYLWSQSDFVLLFSWFYTCILHRGKGRHPSGAKFWCQQKRLVTSFICCKFQYNLFEVWFLYIFFRIYYMCIAPGHGQTAPQGTNFDVHRKVLLLSPFVASLKKNSLKSEIYTLFFFFLVFFFCCCFYSWLNTCI